MSESLSAVQGNINVDGEIVKLAVLGMGGCAFQLNGSMTLTVTFEGTVDGQAWAALAVVSLGDPTAVVTTATAAGIWLASCAGLLEVRARCSAYTNGAALVMIRAVESAPSMPILAGS